MINVIIVFKKFILVKRMILKIILHSFFAS